MVWLLRTECATMRIQIRVRIRFWSIRHLNVIKSKNLISNFSLNQHNFESSSNHIRLPNMHTAHTHTLCFYSRWKCVDTIGPEHANALKLVWTMLCERFCDAIKWILNIDFVVETNTKTSSHRFCNHFLSEKWQSPFEYMYAYLTFDRVFGLHAKWLQSIGLICFIRNVIVRFGSSANESLFGNFLPTFGIYAL